MIPADPSRAVVLLGKNTLPLIARVFSDRTLKIVGPFYLMSMPGEVKDPTRVIYNVTYSGLNHFSIMVPLAMPMGELCAPPTAVSGAA